MSVKALRSIFNSVVEGKGPACHRVEMSYTTGSDGKGGWQRLVFYGSNRDGTPFEVVRVIKPDENPEVATKAIATELTG